jgi:mannose-1-phosphate guanylyltransferase
MSAAFAIIMAGGGGTRLWPSSRRRRPKQLLRLGAGESLLAAAVRRASALVGIQATLIVTAADQEDQIRRELPHLPPENVVAEPGPRNTAAAVALGAAVALRRCGGAAAAGTDADPVLLVLPADPSIGDEALFASVVRAAMAEGRGTITTIGIKPAFAETGFGYIRLGPRVAAGPSPVHEVAAFVEKPDRPTAERYVSSGEYLWNSGMFFLTAGRLRDEARRHLPALGQAMDAIVGAADFAATVRQVYPGLPSISIDNGIMEKASGLRVVPGDFGWNDVGSWAALPAIRPRDGRGNVVVAGGDAAAAVIDCDGSVVVAEEGAPFVGVAGVRDLVVVVTADAVLVIPKDRAQDVRLLVEAARKAGRQELL